MKYLLILSLVSFITSCGKETATSGLSAGQSGNGSQDTGSTSGGTVTSKVSCTGSTQDGEPDTVATNSLSGFVPIPLIHFKLNLAGNSKYGGANWKPGNHPKPGQKYFYEFTDVDKKVKTAVFPDGDINDPDVRWNNTIPTLEDAGNYFKNDGPYFVRVKLLEEYGPPARMMGCFERTIQKGDDGVRYKTVRFKVRAHGYYRDGNGEIVKDNFNSPTLDVLNPKTGNYWFEVSVNKCSEPIMIPPLPTFINNVPAEEQFTFAEVYDLRTDELCQQGQDGECFKNGPGKLNVLNDKDCLQAILQFATNTSEFFKGYNRLKLLGNGN